MLFCNNMEAIHLDDERFLFMRPLLEEHDLALGVWIAGDELRHRPPTPVVVRLVNQAVNFHHIIHPDRSGAIYHRHSRMLMIPLKWLELKWLLGGALGMIATYDDRDVV